jgi:hypothetical protein
MSNETSLQNGAADKGGETKPNTERALLGKIARLPKEIREQLNQRLDDGQPGSEVLPWLNELPAVKEVLGKHFHSVPISDTNLCHWRGGGFQRWVRKQEALAELKEFAEDIEDYSGAAGERLARGTAMLASAKILQRLQTMPAEGCEPAELIKLAFATTALAQVEQNNERLKNEKTRVFQGNERLVLSWDKHLRDCVDTAQRALNDDIAKAIQEANIDNGEKIELLGHHMFGKKWQGREIEKKEEPKNETEEVKKEAAEKTETKGKVAHEKAMHHETVNQGLVPRPEEARPHPNPLPQERENHRPMVGNDERPEAARTTVTADDEKAGTKGAEGKEPAEKMNVKAVPEKSEGKISGGLTTAATPKGQGGPTMTMGSITASVKTIMGKTMEKISGSLTTAATASKVSVPSNPKQKAPAPVLSPYEKAILEGKTHLEAMYAQYTPVKKAQPKPQGDTSLPKPNPLDAFSEPVKPSPFAPLHGLLRRGSLWGSKVG